MDCQFNQEEKSQIKQKGGNKKAEKQDET